jgi:hypothetical protein
MRMCRTKHHNAHLSAQHGASSSSRRPELVEAPCECPSTLTFHIVQAILNPQQTASKLRRPCASYRCRAGSYGSWLSRGIFAKSISWRCYLTNVHEKSLLADCYRSDSNAWGNYSNTVLHLSPTRCDALIAHGPSNPA